MLTRERVRIAVATVLMAVGVGLVITGNRGDGSAVIWITIAIFTIFWK